MEKSGRLASLDALRGFDMMFIMGMAAIITAVCGLFPDGDACWLAQQMHHVKWDGFHHHDTIFPLFLFIAGVSFPFSYAKQVSSGASRSSIYLKIFRRAVLLVLLGMVYNGLLRLDFANQRFYSVLGRIGLAWMFAALLFINLGPKPRAVVASVLLVGYYLLIRFVPAPDMPGADPLSLPGNFGGYVDRLILKNHLLYDGVFDPEGLLGVIPATVTAMLGMFTGEFVRHGGNGAGADAAGTGDCASCRISGERKTVYMFAAAAVLTAAGLLWSLDFPINKALWSSSFVLVVGGFSLASFALFYYIIDVRGWRKWAFPFQVIGMNSLTIYLGQKIIPFRAIRDFFLKGAADLCPPEWGTLVLEIGYFAVCWLFLYFLYRKNTFLKV